MRVELRSEDKAEPGKISGMSKVYTIHVYTIHVYAPQRF